MADWDTLFTNADIANMVANGDPYGAIEAGVLGIAGERAEGGRP